jgi:hypothetical protein
LIYRPANAGLCGTIGDIEANANGIGIEYQVCQYQDNPIGNPNTYDWFMVGLPGRQSSGQGLHVEQNWPYSGCVGSSCSTNPTFTNIYVHFFDFNASSCWVASADFLGTGKVVRVANPTPSCTSLFQELDALPSQNNGFLYILGIGAGILLFIIGLGLGFSASGFTFQFSLTPNSQGTRLAQALGIALLVFIPTASEFGGWVALIPLALGVPLNIFFLGSTFFGIYDQMSSSTAGEP